MTIFKSPKLGLEFITDPRPGWPGGVSAQKEDKGRPSEVFSKPQRYLKHLGTT
jgi:hypothetical protein